MALPDPALPAADHPAHLAWHALAAEEVARHHGVDLATGLDASEVASRLAHHGPNRISETPGKPAWKRLAEKFGAPLVLVLIAAGAITGALGEWADASVIFGVVLVNAVIGYWQEAKAEGVLAALARSVATPVTVRRGGSKQKMEASQLVPADLRLFQHANCTPTNRC